MAEINYLSAYECTGTQMSWKDAGLTKGTILIGSCTIIIFYDSLVA